jgi:hypothetical protein
MYVSAPPALAEAERAAAALACPVYSTTELGAAVRAARRVLRTAKPVPTKVSVVAFWESAWSHTRSMVADGGGGRAEGGGEAVRLER